MGFSRKNLYPALLRISILSWPPGIFHFNPFGNPRFQNVLARKKGRKLKSKGYNFNTSFDKIIQILTNTSVWRKKQGGETMIEDGKNDAYARKGLWFYWIGKNRLASLVGILREKKESR